MSYYGFRNGRIIFESNALVQLIIYSTPKPPENIEEILKLVRQDGENGISILETPDPVPFCNSTKNCFTINCPLTCTDCRCLKELVTISTKRQQIWLSKLSIAFFKFDQSLLSSLLKTNTTYIKLSFQTRKDMSYPKLLINART
jgi:hypothetical protein